MYRRFKSPGSTPCSSHMCIRVDMGWDKGNSGICFCLLLVLGNLHVVTSGATMFSGSHGPKHHKPSEIDQSNPDKQPLQATKGLRYKRRLQGFASL